MTKLNLLAGLIFLSMLFSCHKDTNQIANTPPPTDSTVVPKPDSTKPVPDSAFVLSNIKTSFGSNFNFEYDGATKKMTKFYYSYTYSFDSTYIYYNTDGTVKMFLHNKSESLVAKRYAAVFVYDSQKRIAKIYEKRQAPGTDINLAQLTNLSDNNDIASHDSLVYDSKNRIATIYTIGADLIISDYYTFTYWSYNDSLISTINRYRTFSPGSYPLYEAVKMTYDTSKISPYYRDLKLYSLVSPYLTPMEFFPSSPYPQTSLTRFLTLSRYPCIAVSLTVPCSACTPGSSNGVLSYNAQKYPSSFVLDFDYINYFYKKI